MPVNLYCGNDEYSINKELKKLRNSVLDKNFADLNRKILFEKTPKQLEIKDIVELIETPSIMFGNILIEIHSTSLFTRGKTEEEKALTRLIKNIETLENNIYLVFICIFPKDTERKIDNSKKLVKTIKERGQIREFYNFKFYETNKVIDWILKTAKAKDLILSYENAALLQAFAGSDLRTLDNELEKLKTNIIPEKKIKKTDIEKLSQNNEDAFKVLDLWLKGDKLSTYKELNKLMQKEAPQKIIALFQTITKRWLRIKLEAEYSNAAEIAKNIGAHPFFVQNELLKLRNIEAEKLLNMRKNLNEAEFSIKSGVIKSELALEMVMVM